MVSVIRLTASLSTDSVPLSDDTFCHKSSLSILFLSNLLYLHHIFSLSNMIFLKLIKRGPPSLMTRSQFLDTSCCFPGLKCHGLDANDPFVWTNPYHHTLHYLYLFHILYVYEYVYYIIYIYICVYIYIMYIYIIHVYIYIYI